MLLDKRYAPIILPSRRAPHGEPSPTKKSALTRTHPPISRAHRLRSKSPHRANRFTRIAIHTLVEVYAPGAYARVDASAEALLDASPCP
ncbi:Uncharacterised protein [Mycobacteroides abscessus subsp. abscessus]|nr:Uncharacterised protein [Mycobacteroides abscessus subsp. abscessus]